MILVHFLEIEEKSNLRYMSKYIHPDVLLPFLSLSLHLYAGFGSSLNFSQGRVTPITEATGSCTFEGKSTAPINKTSTVHDLFIYSEAKYYNYFASTEEYGPLMLSNFMLQIIIYEFRETQACSRMMSASDQSKAPSPDGRYSAGASLHFTRGI
jgi:hypothetical protein